MILLNLMVCTALMCNSGSFVVDDAATCMEQAEQVEEEWRRQWKAGVIIGYSSFCDKKPHFKLID